MRASAPSNDQRNAVSTIIDRAAVEQAVDQTGVELVDEYGEIGCFAVVGSWKEVIEFFMLIARHDHALGVNLNDSMCSEYGEDAFVCWFPGFKLEPIPGDYRDPGSKWEVEAGMLDPEGDDPFRGSDI